MGAFEKQSGCSPRPFMRLLAVGDLHLGRGIRIPDSLESGEGLGPDRLGPAAVWQRICRHAVAEEVDALLLAGDVIDRSENRFEAVVQLQRGLDVLAASGIPCLAVAGNHDAEALPAVLERVKPLELLGADGNWECRRIENGKGAVQVVGWSFPSAEFARSPLGGFDRTRLDPSIPTIGLLHADLDASAGVYAPVKRSELLASGVESWLIGHIHLPGKPRPGFPGYLGSATALDPSETGPHGPWQIELFAGGRVVMRQLPLAPMRWEQLRVDLSSLPGAVGDDAKFAAVENLLAARVRSCVDALRKEPRSDCRPELLALRIILEGTLEGHMRFAHRLPGLAGMREYREGILALVTECIDEAGEPIDLQEFAQRSSPPGILARQLLSLEQADWDGPAWRELRAVLRETGLGAPWSDAQELWTNPGEDSMRGIVQRVGMRRLEDLLQQKTPEAGP